MTTLSAGQTVTLTIGDGASCSVASNGGLATVVVTPTVGPVQTVQIGPLPCRQSFGGYSEGAVLAISSQTASVDYDQAGGNAVTAEINPVTGGITKIAKLTQAQYDAIVTKDDSTLYVIVA